MEYVERYLVRNTLLLLAPYVQPVRYQGAQQSSARNNSLKTGNRIGFEGEA